MYRKASVIAGIVGLLIGLVGCDERLAGQAVANANQNWRPRPGLINNHNQTLLRDGDQGHVGGLDGDADPIRDGRQTQPPA